MRAVYSAPSGPWRPCSVCSAEAFCGHRDAAESDTGAMLCSIGFVMAFLGAWLFYRGVDWRHQ
jgi:hypothetical protein